MGSMWDLVKQLLDELPLWTSIVLGGVALVAAALFLLALVRRQRMRRVTIGVPNVFEVGLELDAEPPPAPAPVEAPQPLFTKELPRQTQKPAFMSDEYKIRLLASLQRETSP